MSEHAGRAARRSGAAAAAGVRHMAHRFIVGESPRAALRSICATCGSTAPPCSLDLLGEATVTQAEADRYAARCLDALETLAEAAPRLARRGPRSRRDSLGPLPRVNLSVKVSALTPAAAPRGARGRPRRRGPAHAAAAARARRSWARTCTSTWSRSTRSRRRCELVFELLDEPELRDGPSAGIVLQAYLRESPEQLERVLDWARVDRARSRRSWCGWSRAPTGTTRWSRRASTAGRRRCSRRRPSPTATSRSSRGACSRRGRSCGRRSPRTTCARSRTRSPPTAPPAREDRDLELQVLRGLGDDLAAALADARTCACASTARWATWSPGWPTWCGGCSRTPRTSRSSATSSAASPIEELLAAP